MLVSKGAGITAGLEIHFDGRFTLVDVSPDKRFAADVSQWTPLIKKRRPARLNTRPTKKGNEPQ